MLRKWTCNEKRWCRFLIWILIGFLVGTTFASMFYDVGKECFLRMEEQMWNTVKSMHVLEVGYVVNEVIVQAEEILVLVLFMMSSWYDVLLFLFWFRKGFLFGIFMGMLAKCHGFRGLLLGMCYAFPKGYIYTFLEYGVIIVLLNMKHMGNVRKQVHMFARGMRCLLFVGGIIMALVVGALAEVIIGFKVLLRLVPCCIAFSDQLSLLFAM